MKMDFSDFDKKFNNIVNNTIPKLTEKGLGVAMLQVLNDCINEVPTVPIREGWLRGSGSIFVQNKLITTSEGMSKAKAGKANKSHSETLKAGEFSGVIGFNTPYASKVHEGVDMHFKEPSSGAKFLETKLHRNKERYMTIISNRIRDGR